MPPIALMIISGIEAAISLAPKVVSIVENGKAMIGSLFEGGLITNDQQNQLNDRIEATAEAFADDKVPSHWTVQPD